MKVLKHSDVDSTRRAIELVAEDNEIALLARVVSQGYKVATGVLLDAHNTENIVKQVLVSLSDLIPVGIEVRLC